MASSLLNMARRGCAKNIDGIIDIGEMPYDMVAPFIRKIQNPEQLRLLEANSPQLAGETIDLWKAFIKRDIQQWEQKLIPPKNPALWWKVYRKLKREDNAQKAVAEEALKAALSQKSQQKKANSTQIVHAVIPQVKTSRWGESRPTASGAQALRNTRTGTDALAVIRRQTANQQLARGITKSIPNHALGEKRSTVVRAPQSMLNEYAYAKSPVKPVAPRSAPPRLGYEQASRPVVFAPRMKPTHKDQALNAAIIAERKDQARKEEKLRALTGAHRHTTPAPNSATRGTGSGVQQSSGTPTARPSAPASSHLDVSTNTKPIAQVVAQQPHSAARVASPRPAKAAIQADAHFSRVPERSDTASPAPGMAPRKRKLYDPMMSTKRVKH